MQVWAEMDSNECELIFHRKDFVTLPRQASCVASLVRRQKGTNNIEEEFRMKYTELDNCFSTSCIMQKHAYV
jgi:hypothetical protein